MHAEIVTEYSEIAVPIETSNVSWGFICKAVGPPLKVKLIHDYCSGPRSVLSALPDEAYRRCRYG
jgi:hypothetical protein